MSATTAQSYVSYILQAPLWADIIAPVLAHQYAYIIPKASTQLTRSQHRVPCSTRTPIPSNKTHATHIYGMQVRSGICLEQLPISKQLDSLTMHRLILNYMSPMHHTHTHTHSRASSGSRNVRRNTLFRQCRQCACGAPVRWDQTWQTPSPPTALITTYFWVRRVQPRFDQLNMTEYK